MLENKNTVLAVVLSVAILFAFNFLTKILYPQPAPVQPAQQPQTSRPASPAYSHRRRRQDRHSAARRGNRPGRSRCDAGAGNAGLGPGPSPHAGANAAS